MGPSTGPIVMEVERKASEEGEMRDKGEEKVDISLRKENKAGVGLGGVYSKEVHELYGNLSGENVMCTQEDTLVVGSNDLNGVVYNSGLNDGLVKEVEQDEKMEDEEGRKAEEIGTSKAWKWDYINRLEVREMQQRKSWEKGVQLELQSMMMPPNGLSHVQPRWGTGHAQVVRPTSGFSTHGISHYIKMIQSR
ncbi:hypothetical protein LWI29_037344 [Acer saccharum]|uniref:Uncharacterized protein n=1 Tax=Acer saccharum TaxID=4024 RepID=A0AA39S1C6_ACESA|nr:hypothetical protein LWI29_037344 [Acer saccharum]